VWKRWKKFRKDSLELYSSTKREIKSRGGEREREREREEWGICTCGGEQKRIKGFWW
jgi:hypothetical protein